MPVFQRALRVVGAMRRVALHAPHQAQVRPANVAAIGTLHLEQRLDVQRKALVRIDPLHHRTIEAVQAVDKDDVIGADLHRRLIELALAGLEIIVGDPHLLARDQGLEMLVDQGQIERLRRLIVIVAELVHRVLFEVVKVVVHRERDQPEAHVHQQVAEFDGGGGFAGGGGPGHDGKANLTASLMDHVRSQRDVILVRLIGFGDDLRKLAPRDALVELVHGLHAVIDAPVEHLIDLAPGDVLPGQCLVLLPLLPASGALVAVEDIGLGSARMAVLDQDSLDDVLDVLHVWDDTFGGLSFQLCDDLGRQILGDRAVSPAHRNGGAIDRVGDAVLVKGHNGPCTFDHRSDCCHSSNSCACGGSQ